MSKRNILIISGGIVIVLFLILAFFLRGDSDNKPASNTQNTENVFPSGSNNVPLQVGESSGQVGSEESESIPIETTKEGVPKIRKISFKEVSGYGLFLEGSTTTIRFVDRESGNILEVNSKSLNTKRITNTTILQSVDSFWIDKENVVLQYIDEDGNVATFSAKVVPSKTAEGGGVSSLVGSFAEKNIESLSILNKKIFTLVRTISGSSGVVLSPDLKSQNEVLNTPLREIVGGWVNKDTIAINTKPASGAYGYLFYLNIGNGNLESVLSEKKGLITNISQNGKGILYSVSENMGVSLWFIEKKNGEAKKLGRDTLAEKCVWSPEEGTIVYCAVAKNGGVKNLPDEWYKGNVSFSDNLWKINIETGETESIVDFEKTVRESVDVMKITINEKGNYLSFINKTDMTLWGIDLSK